MTAMALGRMYERRMGEAITYCAVVVVVSERR